MRLRAADRRGAIPTSSASGAGVESIGEERQYPVERLAGRVTRLVDEVLGEDRVRAPRDPVRISLGGVDLDRDERIAERPPQRVEPRLGHRGIVGEPETHETGAG